MTQIDLELKSMAKSALREYISSRGAIDWEQRRYEIAKDVLCACLLPVEQMAASVLLIMPLV